MTLLRDVRILRKVRGGAWSRNPQSERHPFIIPCRWAFRDKQRWPRWWRYVGTSVTLSVNEDNGDTVHKRVMGGHGNSGRVKAECHNVRRNRPRPSLEDELGTSLTRRWESWVAITNPSIGCEYGAKVDDSWNVVWVGYA